MKPYVVSGDVDILLARWAARHNFSLPGKKFFTRLQDSLVHTLASMFESVEFIPSAELENPASVWESARFPLVTLDRVYVLSSYRIELTRTTLPNLEDGPVGVRGGTPDIGTQLYTLRERLGSERDIIIYDDVIYSGHLLAEACRQIEAAGFSIKKVLCGIGIRDGIQWVREHGWGVQCTAKEYDAVVDQVCERDFYPGVDYCGRTLATDRTVGLPYLLPFGNPVKWASIPPEDAARFSRFCIGQSICLFEEIQRRSRRIVFCSHIDRKLSGFSENGAIFVDYLRGKMQEIA